MSEAKTPPELVCLVDGSNSTLVNHDPPKESAGACEDCGTKYGTTKEDCPYIAEIDNESVSAVLCNDCYGNRVMEI